MMHRVFVDGQEGTTGLEIHQRLEGRADIEILHIHHDKRKDTAERKKCINEADIVFLCLPDAAAREAAALVQNDSTRVIDASTAHRTLDDWAYGIPELSQQHRQAICEAMRVSVPGCYATGFNMIVYPLVACGIVPADLPVSCHAVTGYSGGGKQLIATFESPDSSALTASPSFYALGLQHKHLPEMQKRSGLTHPPLFTPIIANYYRGMTVAVPLFKDEMTKNMGAEEMQTFLSDYYQGQRFVRVMPYGAQDRLEMGYLNATGCNQTNRLELFVFGDERQVLIIARLDNLGKGASGAAVQNMNIMLGLDEACGLEG